MARVAFVSPLPPERTGIATYAAAVLEGIAAAGTEHEIDRVWPLGRSALARVREADVGVFQIGNNVEFHGDIYALSVWNPGVVVLHDLAIDGLIWGLGEVKSPLAARGPGGGGGAPPAGGGSRRSARSSRTVPLRPAGGVPPTPRRQPRSRRPWSAHAP
jgi:hypothetical protein